MALQIRAFPLKCDPKQSVLPIVIGVLWKHACASAATWTLRDRVDSPTEYVRSWYTPTNEELFRLEVRYQRGTATVLMRAAVTISVADIVDELEWWLSMWLGQSVIWSVEASLEIQRGGQCWCAMPRVEHAYPLELRSSVAAVATTAPITEPTTAPTQFSFRRSCSTSASVLTIAWLHHPVLHGDAVVFENARGRVYAGSGAVFVRMWPHEEAALTGCPYAIVLHDQPIDPHSTRFEAVRLLAAWMRVNDAAFPDIARNVQSVDWGKMFFMLIPEVCARFTLVDSADQLSLVPRGIVTSRLLARGIGLDCFFKHRVSTQEWIVANQDTAFEPMEHPPLIIPTLTWKQYSDATPAFVRAKNYWIAGDLVVLDNESADAESTKKDILDNLRDRLCALLSNTRAADTCNT